MRRLLLVLAFLGLMVASMPLGRAQADYRPGVKPGDMVTYGQVSASWVGSLNPQSPFANFLNVSNIQNTVSNVNQDNVTLQQVKTYNNGTVTSSHLLYNTQTGYGNYTPTIEWVIARGLAAPEATYETPQAPTITQTVEKVYLGNVRTVNVLTQFQVFTGGYASLEADYDQKTGILVYLTETLVYSNYYYVTAHLNIMITQTSLWSPPLQPDFAIYANPFKITILRGTSVNSTITLQSLNSYGGTVSISQTTNPAGPAVTFNQTSFSIASGGSVPVNLNFATSQSIATATYRVNVTATSGSLVRYTVLNITVTGPSYSLSPSQQYIAVPTNSSGTDVVTVTSVGRFNGTVTLRAVSLSSGPVPSLSPSTITIKAGTNTTTLSVTTQLVPAGYYTLQVNGTGPLLQPIYIYLQVLPGPPDFTISLNPPRANYDLTTGEAVTHIILTSVNEFVGTININLYWINGSQTTFLGLDNPYLSAYGSTSIQLKSLGPPISIGCCGILQVVASSGPLTHSVNFTIYVPPGPNFNVAVSPAAIDVPLGVPVTANVTVTNTDTFSGPIEWTLGISGGFYGSFNPGYYSTVLAPGVSATVVLQINPSSPSSGTYNFTIYGSDIGHSHTARLALTILRGTAGFTLIPVSPVTGRQGSSITSRMYLASIGNFYANISISASPGSSGLLLSWTSQKILLTANASLPLALGITIPGSTQPGNYTVTVTSSGNGVFNRALIIVRVLGLPDFAVTLSTSQFSIEPGGSSVATVTLSGVYGFNGTVSVAAATTSGGPILTLSRQSITLSYLTSSDTATLTVLAPNGTPSGTYTVTVTATNGTATRQTTMMVAVAQSAGTQQPSAGGLFTPLNVGLGLLVSLMAGLAVVFIIIRRNSRKGRSNSIGPSPPTMQQLFILQPRL